MQWRRALLSLVFVGSCVWCLALVEQVHSQEKAASGGERFQPIAPARVLAAVESGKLEDLRKALESDPPEFKALHEHAVVVAELYNVRAYLQEKPEAIKAPIPARDALMGVAKAAKAKDAAEAKKQFAAFKAVPQVAKDAEWKRPAEPYKPVGPVHELMEVQEDYFGAVRKQIASPEPDFEKIASDILVVAELSNVNSHQSEQEDYRGWAAQTRDLCVKLARAAKADEAADARKTQLKGVYREIHTTCGKCHDKYQ